MRKLASYSFLRSLIIREESALAPTIPQMRFIDNMIRRRVTKTKLNSGIRPSRNGLASLHLSFLSVTKKKMETKVTSSVPVCGQIKSHDQNNHHFRVSSSMKFNNMIAELCIVSGAADVVVHYLLESACLPLGFDRSNNAADFRVFISFRGKDTRTNFVSHLREALNNEQQVKVIIDEDLPKGHSIWPSLSKAIESSHVSIVVFSQDYASSEWCLYELVKILETRKQKGQEVLPVFYNIDPSDVRHQRGSFKQAFETHMQKFGRGEVQIWKSALTEAADLIGWDSKSAGGDADLIKQIVKSVLQKKNRP